jgi:predicted ATP-grasp superfamily ATP-dependent carboligase
MSQAARFLVVAHSARLLAQSAARAGYPVCALDLFNDADTGRFALASEAVDSRAGDGAGFDPQDLLQRAARLCPAAQCLGLVYGAGFEDDTETLKRLAHGRALFGNPPELVARLKDPTEFFGLLDRLSIPHPLTMLTRPDPARGWLYKRSGAAGGTHVVDAWMASVDPVASTGYFQRRTRGRNLSLLFLADGRRAYVVGVSRQLTRGVGERRYTYAGAVGPIDLPAPAAETLLDTVQALVGHTGLVGCNSIDFLLDGDRPALLEINPRPSATMDLYDHDWPGGLFDAHVQACRGRLPGQSARRRGGPVRAHAIVYASARVRIAPDAVFPAWCSDIPRPGSDVAIDAPICTVHADGADPSAALRQLGRRRRQTHLRLTG